MTNCCGGQPKSNNCTSNEPLAWFEDNIDHCLDYAEEAKSQGRPIVGIMCEYAPRELIMAAGGVPVCLCGGSAKTIPAAEEHLPVNLCPLIKSTFGYHVTNKNPFLEMADLVVAETTCDGKKKMFELMAQTRPVHLMELPHKQDPDAFEYWLLSMHKLKSDLELRFGVEITPENLRGAIALMNRERSLRRRLAELMKSDTPPITGRQLLEFKSTISGIPADLEQYEKALELYSARAGFAIPPAENTDGGHDGRHDGPAHPCAGPESTDRGQFVTAPAKNADDGPAHPCAGPRVLLTGVPIPRGTERVVDIIESSGGLIVCQENCTGLKPILEDVDITIEDPMRALAQKYFRVHCAVMTPNKRRFDYLRQLSAEYRPSCVIELVWQACQIYDIESHTVRRLAEEELDVPYLRIETDYSPSDSARIAVRVEALFETLNAGRSCR